MFLLFNRKRVAKLPSLPNPCQTDFQSGLLRQNGLCTSKIPNVLIGAFISFCLATSCQCDVRVSACRFSRLECRFKWKPFHGQTWVWLGGLALLAGRTNESYWWVFIFVQSNLEYRRFQSGSVFFPSLVCSRDTLLLFRMSISTDTVDGWGVHPQECLNDLRNGPVLKMCVGFDDCQIFAILRPLRPPNKSNLDKR